MASRRQVKIALAGNPNSGKTSIFNALTGAKQKVANFPGVTVEKRVGYRKFGLYDIIFVDLPGTYSLTAYSLDEKVARDFIINEQPDVIINVIDTANLERSLYLTMQVIEMGVDLVIDLNMWDEAQEAGIEVDTDKLARLLGAPVAKTVANRGQGIDNLLQAAVTLIESDHDDDEEIESETPPEPGRRDRRRGRRGHSRPHHHHRHHRHPPVSYGPNLDDIVKNLADQIETCRGCEFCHNPRWMAIKLLENDPAITGRCFPGWRGNQTLAGSLNESIEHIKATTNEEPEMVITEGRYGYVAGIVREVMKKPQVDRMMASEHIDNVATHRILGYPIFFIIMWLIFQATFKIGQYPMGWIESGVGILQWAALSILPAGMLSDLIVDGIIGGVGAVIVFLPNIVILFLGISILEDSGYMARAAFLMDRLMHLLGLHGKSFIPLLMGFGCSVPAIMSTRTLESQKDRILTILLIPYMSCSAKLPVYILIAGAFFGAAAGNVIFGIYILGILLAVAAAYLFRKTVLRSESIPFVMELPPYRRPTTKSVLIHVWERARIYLKKMGGVILVASIILWALGYFPRKTEYSVDYEARIEQLRTLETEQAEAKAAELEAMKASEEVEYTYIGRLGQALAPVMDPLGFNWRMGVSLVTGFFAKEVVVSSLGVLYQIGEKGEKEAESLMKKLRDPESGLSKLVAFGFMVFVLLYTPCIAAIIAIRREVGWRWMTFTVVFQLALAWLAALVIYQGGRLLGL